MLQTFYPQPTSLAFGFDIESIYVQNLIFVFVVTVAIKKDVSALIGLYNDAATAVVVVVALLIKTTDSCSPTRMKQSFVCEFGVG